MGSSNVNAKTPNITNIPWFHSKKGMVNKKKNKALASVVRNIIRVSWRRGEKKIWGDSLKAYVERQLIVSSEFFFPTSSW